MIRLDNIAKDVLIGAAAGPAVKKLEKAAEGFEKVFLKDLLSAMRKAAPSLNKDSFSTGMYRDMLDDAYAESAASRGEFGIARQILDTMKPQLLRAEFDRIKRELKSGELKLDHIKLDLKR